MRSDDKEHQKGVILALDVGATGMKVVTADADEKGLEIRSVHSLPTRPRVIRGVSYVDTDSIIHALTEAILSCGDEKILSAGIDTFGNGYGILDEEGNPLSLPYDYRDSRVDDIMQEVHRHYSDRELYELTGNFPFRSRGLFHLFKDVLDQTDNITKGKVFLPLTGLIEYLLTGVINAERTFCSVLYVLDVKGETWNRAVFDKLGIPTDFLPQVSDPGRILGPISRRCSNEITKKEIPLISVIGHDTESALIMAPDMDEHHAFVCMGTSFIFGTRLKEPLVNDETYRCRFKNMRGGFGRYSLCKDFPGFWLMEQCREIWRRENPDLNYEDINHSCVMTPGGKALLDINDERFRIAGQDIMEKIRDYCTETGQHIPEGMGELTRCIYESYCCFIRWNIDAVTKITGNAVTVVDVFNGGTKNRYLMQLLSDALGLPVITNGRYASACGNLLMQYAVLYRISEPEELTGIASGMTKRQTFYPVPAEKEYWDQRYQAFLRIRPLETI